jgi:hypothetical protein
VAGDTGALTDMITSWFTIGIKMAPKFLYRNHTTDYMTFAYINSSKFNTSYEALLLNEYRTRKPLLIIYNSRAYS